MEYTNKHITNFAQFAHGFTKVFMPIVETAIKMSSEEPVSAYAVFKAANNMPNANKKSKKNQKGSGNAKNKNKGAVKKVVSMPTSLGNAAGKLKGGQKNKNKKVKGKEFQQKQKSTDENNIEGSFSDVVEDFFTADLVQLPKEQEQKKEDLENYLVKQLEMDDDGQLEDDGSFDSEGAVGEYAYSGSDTYSDEYTVNKSSSFSDNQIADGEPSSTTEDDNRRSITVTPPNASKSNKKRKSPEVNLTKAASGDVTNKAVAEVKKSKKSSDNKSYTRKSLPAAKADKVADNSRLYRTSLDSLDDSSTKSGNKHISNKASVTTMKLSSISPPPNITKLNSIEEGKRVLKWLLNPVTADDFFSKYWEQTAIHIKRQQSNYFRHLISFEAIDQMLLKNHVEFTKNIDVTSYKNGVRDTLNPEGRALPPVVWDHYGQGCSIRLLNPQTFLPALFTVSTTMQEYFHCLVGANAYLTPPNSQGFAPHYDDIEAFVLQIEGRKRWKLYKPRSTSEILPRYSSKNFSQEEIGKPVMEEVLEPGDVLYFPRGTIHQACTEPGYHSLHITLSCYQKQSFADLFEKMLPLMLQKAIAANVDLRRGIPLHTWQHAGIVYNNNSSKERADITKSVTQLMRKFINDMPLEEIMDAGVDQLAKKFQHEALPPEILPAEKNRTVFGSRSRTNERGECVCDYDIDERTNVRLLRANILRLVEEEDRLRIYYYSDNSKEYCQYDPNFIEIEALEAASVEVLIKSYPQYVGVSQLPLPSDEQKINLAAALWERGLLMMEKPFR